MPPQGRRVPVHGDQPQVLRPGPELMADKGIDEQPRVLGLLEFVVPGAGIRRRADIDLRRGAVAPRGRARDCRRLRTRPAQWGRRPCRSKSGLHPRCSAKTQGVPRWMNWCRYAGLRSIAYEAMQGFGQLKADPRAPREMGKPLRSPLFPEIVL